MEVIAALRTCSLFADFSESDLKRLAEIARTRAYDRGQQIFCEGDPAAHFYAVVTGKVKLYKLSPEGKYHIVRLVSPGELFGEAAAFSRGNYPVFAEAVTRSNLLVFGGVSFLDLVCSEGRLARRVIASLSQRLESLVAVLGQLALSDATARLAKYIVDLSLKAKRAGMSGAVVRLDIRKADLAARLGMVSESLSRSFARLRQRRMIEVVRSEVRILDSEALARTAAGLGE